MKGAVVAVQGRAVVWALLIVATTGCRTREVIPLASYPTAEVLSVGVQDVRPDFATLIFEVRVHNPSAKPVLAKSLQYGLASGANSFLSGTPVSGLRIAPGGTETLTLPDTVVCERLLRALDVRLGTSVPFTLVMRLSLETMDGQAMRAPGRASGQLTLPPLAQNGEVGDVDRPLDVIYIGTPRDVVEKMLAMAHVKRDDLVCDLGCGDGRVLVAAAQGYGCRAAGYDLDPAQVEASRENARTAGVEPLVTAEQKDIFAVDLRSADVVFIYLNPVVNRRLIPQLQTLKRGARVISHSFPIGEIRPDETVTMTSREDGQKHVIYLWTAPLKTD